MKNNQEKDALRIAKALDNQEKASEAKDAPYLRMAKALQEDAKDVKEMDERVMQSQRGHLQQMAKNLKAQAANKKSAKAKKSERKPIIQRWYVWAGGFATVCAVALLVFVQSSGNLQFGQQNGAKFGAATLSLMIPAAHAGDAFDVQVEKDTPSGAVVDTTLRVISKVDVSESDLKNSLRIKANGATDEGSSFVDFNLKNEGNGEYVVEPKEVLAPGEVYKVTIQTAVQDDAGEVRAREFSWAIQTQDVFEVIRSVPGNQTTNVPLDTAIEVMLSQTDWEDPEDYFEIKPAVAGRFETHGRTLVFLPSKPLQPETIYRVTYKKGWGVKDGKTLEEDVAIAFETASETEEYSTSYLHLSNPVLESSLSREAIVSLSASSDLQNTNVEAVGYKISMDQAEEAMKEMDEIPGWAYAPKKTAPILEKYGVSRAFSFSTQIESPDDVWYELVRLPNNIEKGFYAVKLVPIKGDPVWFLLQKTNVGAYAMVDRDQVLLWLTDHESHKSLTNKDVEMNGKKYQTDGQGLVKMPISDKWREYVDDSNRTFDEPVPVEYISVGDKDGGLIVSLVYNSGFGWFPFYNVGTEADLNNWSYILADRPLYRTQDKIEFFGVMQGRDDKEGVGEVVVELRGNTLDYGTYKSKVYAKSVLQTDDQGFFKGELNWKGALQAGHYNLVLVKDGSDAMMRAVEVSDVVKPAYYINIATDKRAVYAGDSVKGNVVVKFFDGTPFSDARVKLNITGGFGDRETMEVKTDHAGFAEFEHKTNLSSCDLSGDYPYCGDFTSLRIEAIPVVGEEGEISAYESVQVWRGKNSFRSKSLNSSDDQTALEFEVRDVDLSRIVGSDYESALLGGESGVVIKSKIYEEYWDKIPNGTRYDPINKKVVPLYRYERRRVEVGEMQSITDAVGKATLKFAAKQGVNYRIVSWFDEKSGARHAVMDSVYKYKTSGNFTADYSIGLSLESAGGDRDDRSYDIGEEVYVRFYQDKEPFTSSDAAFLFVRASNGIRSAVVSQDAEYKFKFSDEDVPNMTVYGIAFTPEGFKEAEYSAALDSESRELVLNLQTDQRSYAPGAQVGLKAKVTDKDGNPVSNARVAVSVVDEALLKAATLNFEEDTLSQIYRWVSNGILMTKKTHTANGAPEAGMGGAEMGGYKSTEAVRKNFKDQAGFIVMQTDAGGYASADFTMPDNITSWRLSGAALTPDMRAGNNVISVAVTKPVFVEAVIPHDLLVSDKPVLKLRAHGVGLQDQGKVKYSISIPTLGVNNQEVEGDVAAPVYVALDSLNLGEHAAIINVMSGGKSDAIERKISVVNTHASHDVRDVVELGPGVRLPDSGVSSRLDLVFESKARASMRHEVSALAHPWSARLESVLAGYMMRDLLRDSFGEDVEADAAGNLLAYQVSGEGGLAILPYASADPIISSKAAAAMPDLFDRTNLANYFWKITDDEKSPRESSIEALSGLAALGEPVLARLRIAAQEKDLSWREDLAVIRGMEAAGDREVARKLLDRLLETGEQKDDLLMVKVSDNEDEILEATAQAAALAAAMAHPSADALSAYVQSNWAGETLTDLDRAMYLHKVVPALSGVDVQVEYAIGDEVKKLDLGDHPYAIVTLTADEWSDFRIVSVNGPAAASFVKREAGETQYKSDALNVSRSYKNMTNPAGNWREGDVIEVTLGMSWQQSAQDGCYMLRDRLPATLIPLKSQGFDPWSRSYSDYAFDVSGGEISFITCKSTNGSNVSYRARVVSLGEYTAEGALLQSMRAPQVAAVSLTEKIKVE